jgi:predicted transcriptional regulator
MILSHSFEQLPVVARDVAIGKVVQVITEGNCDKKYAHLTAAIRREISEVLAGVSPLWKERLAKN